MYAKVFRSLWDGSMRGQPHEQLVFVYMLAHANEDGEVDIIAGKIADDTGLAAEDLAAAILTLSSPDPNSRTPLEDGRRILPLYEHGAWGWRIVNYEFYRSIRNAEERRRQNREAQARYAAKKRTLSTAEHPSAESAQVEVEAEVEVEVERTPETLRAPDPFPDEVAVSEPEPRPRAKKSCSKDWLDSFAVDFWPAYRRPVGKGAALAAWVRLGSGLPDLQAETDLFNAVMDGLEQWNLRHKDDELEFIPHPATWLNQRRWEDEA